MLASVFTLISMPLDVSRTSDLTRHPTGYFHTGYSQFKKRGTRKTAGLERPEIRRAGSLCLAVSNKTHRRRSDGKSLTKDGQDLVSDLSTAKVSVDGGDPKKDYIELLGEKK